MNRYSIYRSIRKLNSLKELRHPMFDRNRFMKVLLWFMFIYYAAILIFLGVVMAMGMGTAYYGVAAFHVFDGAFLWLLITDFWMRFAMQETPAQQVKPFRLLPIRRTFLMHTYLTENIFSWGNLFWAFLLVPFGAIAIVPLLGWSGYILWLLMWWLMIVANGFAYLFCRALSMKHFLWGLLPLAIHAGLACLMLLPEHNPLDMPCTNWLYWAALGRIIPFLVILLVIAFMYWANYRLQMSMLYDEMAKKEEVKVTKRSALTYFNRWGAMGEYLKMEIKLRLRNSQVRNQFFLGLGCIVLISALQYFTDVYDNTPFMQSFICIYDYVVLGMMTLITIMCYEGNYIDCLMSRRESILSLLEAKYYFNSAILLLPIIILTPLIISGKISLWMNLAYLFMTAGIIYPLIFQMAVYNKNTLPLNQKLTGKQGNLMQSIMSMLVMFVPIVLQQICVLALGDIWGNLLIVLFGLIGIATHRMWLRNIYQRMMKRKYINMEGFHSSN